MTEWAFIDHVTDHMARPRAGDERHPSQWPSEATAIVAKDGGEKVVGKCRRAAFFRLVVSSYKFYEKYSHWKLLVERLEHEAVPPDKYLMWIWRQGELYEEYLVEAAKRSGVFVDAQVRIYIKDYNVSGSIDIEVINPTTHKFSIIESKSVYGFGSDTVLGSQYERNQGRMGEPKEGNLMQIGLYHWWRASEDPAYEYSRLVYGSRDTGRYGEFLIRTVTEEDGLIHLEYAPAAPYPGPWVRTGITINSVLNCYAYIQSCVDSGVIPKRDFRMVYNDEELAEAHAGGLLNKTDNEKYEKTIARRRYNNWVASIPELTDEELVAGVSIFADEVPKSVLDRVTAWPEDTVKKRATTIKNLRELEPKKETKGVLKGDWQCSFCQHKLTCYTEEGEPREVSA